MRLDQKFPRPTSIRHPVICSKAGWKIQHPTVFSSVSIKLKERKTDDHSHLVPSPFENVCTTKITLKLSFCNILP